MKVLARLGLPGLLLAVALLLAACGGNAGSSDGGQGDDMQGMDHGGSGGGAAQEETTGGEMSGMTMDETTGGMQDMNHGSMSMEEMARRMVAPDGEYSDAAFVDAMVPHHEGAVEMAQVALDRAEHEEVRTLAREIIDAQRAEIELFGEMREELGGTTTEMSQEEMEGMMGMPMDPRQLAQERPFDRAFIDAMIPHHESAIAMAEVALEESEDPEIRKIAEDIVSAQEREIEQMRRWRQEWYPEG
jgi:uncharacterized protein (DUF305 family)